ncbi:MAG: TolC family protein [Chitinophagaceae bacterium]
MFKRTIDRCIGLMILCAAATGCKVPAITATGRSGPVPPSFGNSQDTTNLSSIRWKDFFTDPDLQNLVDTALKNNQELLITLQEIEIARNDIRFRHASLLPTIGLRAGAGVEKVGRYTSQGAGDASTEIKPSKEMPDPLMDYNVAAVANWEADIWKKLHNAKQAAVTRYLATSEGKNFVLTNLVAEVANSYYELLALDNELAIVKQNIGLQKNALDIVKVQKDAARATELGVQKFQAEVLKSQSLEFGIMQQIKETENRINFLLARYPQDIPRSQDSFLNMALPAVQAGIPAQLLANRPDIRQAELELEAAKLDVKVARAEFYPSLGISAAVGFQAFKPSYLVKFPESLLYSLAGDLAGPLINRNAIKAAFSSANARQLQALYAYERTVLNAYLEVATQLSNIGNLDKSYGLKSQQVDALTRSIDISNDLFRSARVDYFEVLMTQRDALEAKLELIETKKQQLNAVVNVYRNLGGGWR